jgi:hypothetical protein
MEWFSFLGDRSHLARRIAKALVAKLLSGGRPQLAITELTDLASSASVPPARVRRVLLSSPLFLRTRGEQVRLVGHRTRH